MKYVEGDLVVLDQDGFRNLQLEPAWSQTGVLQSRHYLEGEAPCLELRGRNVDGNLQGCRPTRRFLAGYSKHVISEDVDQSGLLGHRNEFGRRDETPLRMIPAGEGLTSDDLAVTEPDDRLEKDLDFTGAKRGAQVGFEDPAVARPLFHGGLTVGSPSCRTILLHTWRGLHSVAGPRMSYRLLEPRPLRCSRPQ